jgi:hypothetical protein
MYGDHIVTAADPLPVACARPSKRSATVASWPSITGAEVSKEPISQRAAEPEAAFNHSVRSGDWATFAGRPGLKSHEEFMAEVFGGSR